MLKCIILDFDGVILESVDIKTEVFRSLFSFVPAHVDKIVEYHISNGGVSRYDKFQYIYREILGEELTNDQFRLLSEKFSNIVYDRVLHAPFVEGALPFLKNFHKKIPLFIASATPEMELTSIITARKLNKYLKGICGAPRKKEECIIDIMTQNGFEPKTILFVGDSPNDYEAARKSGIQFVGRIRSGDDNRFVNLDSEYLVSDLYGLADLLHGEIL